MSPLGSNSNSISGFPSTTSFPPTDFKWSINFRNIDYCIKILENVAQSRYSIVIEMINTDGEKERLRFR